MTQQPTGFWVKNKNGLTHAQSARSIASNHVICTDVPARGSDRSSNSGGGCGKETASPCQTYVSLLEEKNEDIALEISLNREKQQRWCAPRFVQKALLKILRNFCGRIHPPPQTTWYASGATGYTHGCTGAIMAR